MKTNLIKLLVVALLSTFIFYPLSLLGQGALTPPGAPAPTMKTLAQIEPRTPISSAPFTISAPGSYYLTTNLTGTSGNNGITISSGDVTLDLNGFVLRGASGSLDGVRVSGTYTNITVYNGTITGWGSCGVDAFTYGDPRNLVLERLIVSANSSYGIITRPGSKVRDCCAIGNIVNDGIYCNGGLISGCMSRDNGGLGIFANNCAVRDCQVESNHTDGIWAYYSTVRDCNVYNNGHCGIFAAYSTVSGCYVLDSGWSGIIVEWPDCQIIGNNCISNNITGSSTQAGIYIYDSNNRVEDNHVVYSGYAGIQVNNSGSYSNNIIVKNTVIGTNNYIIPAGQIVGPIITNTVSGIITNSNPWANFSF